MRRRGFLGLAAAIGVAALTEGCVTISPLATTGDFPVDGSVSLPGSQTWTRMTQRNGGAGQIVIGVKADQPGLGYFDPATNTYSGFDILIAQMIAAGLGFQRSQIQFSTIASQDRETALENGTVDLVVASYSYETARAKLVYFAGPYFTTPEALLVRTDTTSITSVSAIAGRKACEVSNSTTVAGLNVTPVVRNTYSECVAAVQAKQAEVIYSDYAVLLGYEHQNPNQLKVINTNQDTQYYGIGLPYNDTVLQQQIDKLLNAAIDNGTWRAIFNSTLAPEGLKADPPKVGQWPASS